MPNVAISIIIPLYNAELYIEKCIMSLLNQTLKDIEILVIDDCGSDNSVQVVNKLKQKHDEADIIKIVSMPVNSGAAASRNYGLQIATGEYVGFMDADDWCNDAMFEQLYTQAKQHNADWSFCNAIKEFSKIGRAHV